MSPLGNYPRFELEFTQLGCFRKSKCCSGLDCGLTRTRPPPRDLDSVGDRYRSIFYGSSLDGEVRRSVSEAAYGEDCSIKVFAISSIHLARAPTAEQL